MKPVLVVESILHGAVYKTQQEFYLHAFRTEGYKAGQYGESIVQSVVEGRLTPTEGINLSTLPPLSGCYLGDGMVQLEIGPMKRKDVVLAALTFLKDTMLPVFLFLKRIMPPFLVYVKERVLLAFATFNTRRLIFKTDENLPLTQENIDGLQRGGSRSAYCLAGV
ncbi:hypothetical protein FPV67DRAFT_1091715 [Lyophyllum atratum]|nr:hypothetical protein FPV67DRAFT_1091715 [Lyophyllum atratum]